MAPTEKLKQEDFDQEDEEEEEEAEKQSLFRMNNRLVFRLNSGLAMIVMNQALLIQLTNPTQPLPGRTGFGVNDESIALNR